MTSLMTSQQVVKMASLYSCLRTRSGLKGQYLFQKEGKAVKFIGYTFLIMVSNAKKFQDHRSKIKIPESPR